MFCPFRILTIRHGPTPPALGDIILAFETVQHEALDQDKKLSSHTQHLAVHAMLHLCGYEHDRPETEKEMESLEIKILEKLGIKNPYII